ncbi:LytTR family DNA-binding domain-containing protein [Fulvivirgaceae bacterium BMA12]|uniref:LytTR family DNA-binding domain-containing protein n=1 Tax=Agaribacillus aureus TaxID=3051825 RepID=A0ABT8LCV0_9BACT|nr:LytTR family DNA-binding domain-containing protein [Fulvivirgaceae bacterium BMA12]
MKILIIEDEVLAAKRLVSLLHEYDPGFEILDTIDAVKSAVKWFLNNGTPDLVFMDVQLGDGLSFEIFDYCQIRCPIIFTTAFDHYAIRAFKVNSIDYLLKPFDQDDIRRAFEKLTKIRGSNTPAQVTKPDIEEVVKLLGGRYKTRFIVKIGEHIHSVQVKDALFFSSMEKATFMQTDHNKRYIIDYSLEQVTDALDPIDFFRINRKYLIHINAIQDIVSYSNSRLKIKLKNCDDQLVIVSRDKVQDFKKWLDR